MLARGWQYTIHPSASTFHFALFALHFPKGHLSLPQCSAVRCPTQRAAMANATRCVGQRTALRFPAQLGVAWQGACLSGNGRLPPGSHDGRPSVPLEDISRIYLDLDIIQTSVISVGNNSLTSSQCRIVGNQGKLYIVAT